MLDGLFHQWFVSLLGHLAEFFAAVKGFVKRVQRDCNVPKTGSGIVQGMRLLDLDVSQYDRVAPVVKVN